LGSSNYSSISEKFVSCRLLAGVSRSACETRSPQSEVLLRDEDKQSVRRAVEALPAPLREVVVLRELEGRSYREIATIADIPQGTVMSRLARAREQLRQKLSACADKEI
jgi:RNA polymerase sigma factor (sigma-70 family)